MKDKRYTDQEIVQAVLADDERSKARCIAQLYEDSFKSIRQFVMTNSGSQQDAEDVFHEAILALIKLITLQRFRGEAALKTLLYSIATHKWYDKLRKEESNRRRQERNPRLEHLKTLCEGKQLTPEMMARIKDGFAKLGKGCRDVLVMFYMEYLPSKEIAKRMSFKNEYVASSKKYRCWTKLKKLITQETGAQIAADCTNQNI